MEQKLYFAYGSNINLNQMAYRCPDATPVMPVVLDGYELTYRGNNSSNGVATIIPNPAAKVPGLLWKITPACEQTLDSYEGFPHLYRKESVVVRDQKNNNGYRVMVYIMTGAWREPAVPSGPYFQGIIDGYRQNKMSIRPLLESLKAVRQEVDEMQQAARPYQFNFRDIRTISKPKHENSKKNPPKQR